MNIPVMPFIKDTCLFIRVLTGFLVCCVLWSSCEDQEINIPDGALQEHTVDITGVWKVKKVLLNNVDISQIFDFDQISLTLKMNQMPTDFEIETGTAPFPVQNGGRWEYNDPAYPTSMVFISDGGEESVQFATPPISGESFFTVSFSLGCADNLYTYFFEKVST